VAGVSANTVRMEPYDGTNFREVLDTISAELELRGADHLLQGRVAGDDLLNKKVFAVLKVKGFTKTYRHLAVNAGDVPQTLLALKHHHVNHAAARRGELRESLYTRKQQRNESVANYIKTLQELREDFEDADPNAAKVQDSEFADIAVRGLAEDFKYLRTKHLSERTNSPHTHISAVQSAAEAIESDVRSSNLGSGSAGYAGRGNIVGGSSNNGRPSRRGGRGRNVTGSGGSSGNSGGRGVGGAGRGQQQRRHCHVCGKYGHWGAICRLAAAPVDEYDPGMPQKSNPEGTKRPPHQPLQQAVQAGAAMGSKQQMQPMRGNVRTLVPNDGRSFDGFVAFSAVPSKQPILDSGCSHHMTSERSMLHGYQPLPPGNYIQYGGSERTPVLGSGTLVLQGSTDSSSVLHIPDVWLVVQAQRTLISYKQLLNQYSATAQDGGDIVSLWCNNKCILSAVYRDCLLVVQGHLAGPPNSAVSSSAVACAAVSGEVWHQRLAHCGARALEQLKQRGFVQPTAKGPACIADCKGCACGKASRAPHFSVCAQQRASIVGERVHADLCFPGQEGLQGEGSLLTIIDEASRFAFAFPLVRKADVPEELIEFFSRLEPQGRKVQTLRTDRGGEFVSNQFADWLAKHGI
jgi:hypothetical protein